MRYLNWNWNAIAAVGTWIGALAAVVIGLLVWKSNRRIEWLTGSMESYQMKQLQLEVRRQTRDGVKLVWWDPNVSPWPYTGAHGDEVETATVYLGIPLEHRRRTRLGRLRARIKGCVAPVWAWVVWGSPPP